MKLLIEWNEMVGAKDVFLKALHEVKPVSVIFEIIRN
jgi:hypothetical protein